MAKKESAAAVAEVEPDEVIQAFQIAPRSTCTCGKSLARRPQSKTGNWHCIRWLTGDEPTKVCQKNIPANKVLAVLPPKKKSIIDEEVEE